MGVTAGSYTIARWLRAGMAHINKHAAAAPNAPFGGTQCSGTDVAFGEQCLRACATIKVINAHA